MYDAGRCSYLIDWDVLANQIVMRANIEVAFTPGINNVRHLDTNVSPILRGVPEYPIAFPLGPEASEEALDQIRIRARYRASAGGCIRDPTLVGTLLTSIQPELGFNVGTRARTVDEMMEMVGCEIDFADDVYRCNLVVDVDRDGVPTRLAINTFARDVDTTDVASVDSFIRSVSCVPVRGRYPCAEPFGSERVTERRAVQYVRPVDFVAGSLDLALEVDSASVDINDCVLAGLIEDSVADQLRGITRDFNSQLSVIIGLIAGTRATRDFGIPASDLRTCTSDDDCRVSSFLGNRRHSCIGGVCDGFRIEVRRLNVRPEGLEIVLAEDEADPQFALLNGRPGLLPGDPGLCQTGRRSVPDDALGPLPTPILAVNADPRLSRPLCGVDEVGCTGICPNVGTTCNTAVLLGTTPQPSSSECSHSACCRAIDTCDGFCTNRMTDRRHCGDCGNACSLGENCVGGVCVVP